MSTLETLPFDNRTLELLPVDDSDDRRQRSVRGSVFALMPQPQPLENPQTVCVSLDALELVNLDLEQVQRPEFPLYMSGSAFLPGSRPAAHCYAGYQFGNFAGQLGDGAAMYLGEVVHPTTSERWEMQLKGAGLTPFSRAGDGRKVLRSSLREFLCSEAMYYLGIPTTRAGALVVSDSTVVRDPHYEGNEHHERCAVVLRLAPTFLRFGSFEVFKDLDPLSGREGPSCGMEHELLPIMLSFTLRSYFPHVLEEHGGEAVLASGDSVAQQDMWLQLYREVVLRTASLVAAWQCVGFCHGVLNTDNMSIMGLTLDYGPFGFMERFDHDLVPNGSDTGARYCYRDQPKVCRWNCEKLAEALAPVLPTRLSKEVLTLFDDEYDRTYNALMRHKLGMTAREEEGDVQLASDLLDLMHRCGSDMSGTFRLLASFPMPRADAGSHGSGSDAPASTSGADAGPGPARAPGSGSAAVGEASTSGAGEQRQLGFDDGGVLEALLAGRSSLQELLIRNRPLIPGASLQLLAMLAHRDAALLATLGLPAAVVMRDLDKMRQSDALRSLSETERLQGDRDAWVAWLRRYSERLGREARAGATPEQRVKPMNAVNPRFVLRNWLAQHAIERAEQGDYREVNRLLQLLRNPFAEGEHDDLVRQADGRIPPLEAFTTAGAHGKDGGSSHPATVAAAAAAAAAGGDGGTVAPVELRYDGLAPAGRTCGRVTCSS